MFAFLSWFNWFTFKMGYFGLDFFSSGKYQKQCMHVKIRMSSYPVHYYFFLINADFIANLLPLISNLGKYTTTWGWLVHRTQPRDLKTFQKEVRSCSVWDIDWHASSDSSYPGEVHHPVIFANPLWKGPSEEMQINWEQHICFLETIGNNTGNIFQSFFTVLPLPKRTPLYTDSLQTCSSSA